MILVAGIAALYDIRTWKIPNWLILLGLETGIFITVWQNGVRIGSIRVLAGIWIPIGILYVMFLQDGLVREISNYSRLSEHFVDL